MQAQLHPSFSRLTFKTRPHGTYYTMADPEHIVLSGTVTDLVEVELIPGTEVMKDTEVFHPVHGKHNIILIPAPSKDPADPLNWTKTWKFAAVMIVALYTCFQAVAVLSMAPLFPLLEKEWNLKNSNQLTMITGSSVLVLGYGNFVVIPFSNVFGRRATVLIFGVLFLACQIWQALAKSYGSFIGARSLVGLAASPSETIVVQVVADIFFLHERGAWVGFSMLAAFLGTFLGPVIAGAMAEHHGWRSFFWLSLGIFAFIMVLIVVLFPETKYRRKLNEASTMGTVVLEDTSKPSVQHVDTSEQSAVVAPTGGGRPSMRQYLPIQRSDNRWKAFLIRDFFSPFRIVVYPIILWAALCLTGPADLTLYYNLTESTILSASPYNMHPIDVGYTNFAFAIGSVVGVLTAGPFSDWMIKRATIRNNGIREAEMRLPALIPFGIALAVGMALTAAATQYRWPWPVLVVLGYGSAGLGITSVPTIGIAYAVDCYKPVSGELMVIATVMKNTSGFAMSYWVPSLGEAHGLMVPLMVWFTFTMLPLFLAIPLWIWGKRLRRWTKDACVHKYEELL